ncbi:DUF4440 domain-containing protein [Flavobacterium sp. GT3R68]|uniref:YybH family protein n=1 Tax=Flavobacterium sp. GT3R68 TaxID=2594437 RepID=UPI000F8727CE|nr:DUF4440 domain-containing protein [Flavobacterium sp. GT3R68]RTY92509.1 DUF4440 domain-containing protein [Flavobacterium sp. GSN2]TRW94135.1 DUF4440 domain-containing protein [Flavobacterium sp. GT3R68]
MKKLHFTFIVLAAVIIIGCSPNKNAIAQAEIYKGEIMKAEKDFEKLVADKGVAEGFYHYADANATIKRERDTLITGRDNIRKYYSQPNYKNVSVKWTPDYIEVSKAGDLAYTYGKYEWHSTDASGKEQVSKGVFHTVWKRQPDGSWKYVWD